MLTFQQMTQLKELIKQYDGKLPHAKLFVLASDWGVLFKDLASAVADLQNPPRRPGGRTDRPSSTPFAERSTAVHQPAINLEGIEAAPGAIATLSYNWVLAEARLKSGLTTRDIASACGMSQADYKRLEEGRLLPSSSQAAKMAVLLETPLDHLFVAAAPPSPMKGSRLVRGLSVLGVLRSRRRLTPQQLVDLMQTRGIALTPGTVRQMENNTWAPVTLVERNVLASIAEFFGVETDFLLQRLPAEFVSQVAANTRALHDAIKTAYTALPQFVSALPLLDDGATE